MDPESSFFNSSDYKFTGSNIDEGAFENVFLVKNINLYVVGDQEYASKIINAQSDCSSKEQVNLIRETEIHDLVKFTGIDFHHSSSIQFSLNTSPNNEEQSIKAPSSILFYRWRNCFCHKWCASIKSITWYWFNDKCNLS